MAAAANVGSRQQRRVRRKRVARVRIKFTIVREVGAAKSMRLKHYSCHVDWQAGFAVIARCAGVAGGALEASVTI